MKQKKGFTLAELIGVIIILAIIALLLTPMVDKAIKEFRIDAYNKQIVTICASFENWKGDNLSLLPQEEGDKTTITLDTLKKGGFVEPDLKNPSNGKLFPNDMLIEITKKGKDYTCHVLEDSGENDDDFQIDKPIIALKGSSTIIVEVNTPYEEPGVLAKTASGEEISSEKIEIRYYHNGEEVEEIDTSILDAKYKAVYKVEDRKYSVQLERTILVKDTIAPIITVDGHTSDFTEILLKSDFVGTDWITLEELQALGYEPNSKQVESKIQYGYQEATYTTENVFTDGNEENYGPWYKHVYKYGYVYANNSSFADFTIADTQAKAGTVWSKSVSGWHITNIAVDIDVARKPQWDNYYQPKVDFKCGNTVIYTMPAHESVHTNGSWSGNFLCNGTITIYSYGNTGSGRNWTGSGGGNRISYYTEDSTVSKWVFSKDEIKDAISINTNPTSSGYVLPSWSESKGWRDTTPYEATVNRKPVTRTVYRVLPKLELPVATATDNYDKNPIITTSGNLSVVIPGTYTITYIAKDQSKNTSVLVMTIVIS